jgi:hypothetical protein
MFFFASPLESAGAFTSFGPETLLSFEKTVGFVDIVEA